MNLILKKIKKVSKYDFSQNIKIRDFTEIAQAVGLIYRRYQEEQIPAAVNKADFQVQKEIKVVAMRSYLLMNKMNQH